MLLLEVGGLLLLPFIYGMGAWEESCFGLTWGGGIGLVLYCAVFEGGWGLGCGRVFGFDYQRLGASAVLDKARIFQ